MRFLRKGLKKPGYVLLALLMIAVIGSSATVAYFVDKEESVNQIRVGGFQITTQEKVSGLEKTEIGVGAEGASSSYVRVRVDVPTVTYRYEENQEMKDGSANLFLYEEKADQIELRKEPISAEGWNEYADSQEIPAIVRLSSGDPDQGTSDPACSLATWKKYGEYWYLSTPLNPGDTAVIIGKLTYPGLMVNGSLKLPTGLTESMLTISITSEAVQAGDTEIKDEQGNSLTGADAAIRAFEQAAGQSR